MRPIVLNARAASRPELGGVERWARELTTRLPALAPDRYVVARPPAALVHRAGHAWEQVSLPLRARRAGAGLILSPANTAPVVWPRNVLMLHDAAPLREPRWYSRSYVAWQRLLLPVLTRRACHVLTVSEFSAGEIVDLLHVSPERITVVPGGVDERFRPEADADGARAALGLQRPYVLTVASATARKNLAALAPAADRLRQRGVDLVVAGGDRPQFRDEPTTGALRRVGPVPDEHLPGLYAGAAAFVLPSLYEGFGLTCLEAMAAGTPVLASDRGALPETCGDGALFVDPTDSAAIAVGIERLLDDQGLCQTLREAGRIRAAGFTWPAAAQAIDALLAGLNR